MFLPLAVMVGEMKIARLSGANFPGSIQYRSDGANLRRKIHIFFFSTFRLSWSLVFFLAREKLNARLAFKKDDKKKKFSITDFCFDIDFIVLVVNRRSGWCVRGIFFHVGKREKLIYLLCKCKSFMQRCAVKKEVGYLSISVALYSSTLCSFI
jgi:hypothetical protein